MDHGQHLLQVLFQGEDQALPWEWDRARASLLCNFGKRVIAVCQLLQTILTPSACLFLLGTWEEAVRKEGCSAPSLAEWVLSGFPGQRRETAGAKLFSPGTGAGMEGIWRVAIGETDGANRRCSWSVRLDLTAWDLPVSEDSLMHLH